MQEISNIPSWSELSYSLFEKYLPLIKRWIKSSNSSHNTTEKSIRSLFVKIFYIISAETALHPKYFELLNPEFLKKYSLKSAAYPRSISNFEEIFTIAPKNIPENMVNSFYLMVIHRMFKSVSEKLKITLKSDLKAPNNALFAKSYEIKMLVQLISNDYGDYKGVNFRYGGIAGLFCEYLSEFFNTTQKNPSKKHTQRKKTGSIFTPLWIVHLIDQRILKQIKNSPKNQLSIADISAGYGGFIESIIGNQFFSDHISMNSIFGFDLDPLKIDLLRLNHALLQFSAAPYIEPSHIRLQDTLIHPPSQQFDILIGNPPWGAYIDKSQISKLGDLNEFTIKQYDSFGLFLIRNIYSLKENGLLYLILPETILLNLNYEQVRKFLLEHTRMIEIIHLGENVFNQVNMPAIILGLQKTKLNEEENQVKIYNIPDDSQELKENTCIFRKQSDFITNQGYVFDIFTNSDERRIIEKIDQMSCFRLQELVDNSRGVEIGKKGEVIQCYSCKVWLPIPVWSLDSQSGSKYAKCSVCKQKIFLDKLRNRDSIILDEKPEETLSIPHTPFLLGEDIQKFVITQKKYLILHRRGIKYKSINLYNRPKIVIRKTSQDILATIDYENRYTIQVVYQFSLKEIYRNTPFLLEFLLGIISSKIIQFYYAKKYQYSNRKSFPHHIQKNILNLPIPKIEFSLKEGKFAKFYAQIVFSTLMLMFLNHYEKFQTILHSIQVRLSIIIKDRPDILDIIELSEQNRELLSQNLDHIKDYPSKQKNLQNIIEEFQKILDNAVERLFLSLE
jgi:tRNA1(Val) A37 N6-methylase TrmN6